VVNSKEGDHQTSEWGEPKLRCNGKVIGETGLNAPLAGHFGVPMALISGDNVVEEEARELLGDVETAIVKTAVDRHTARLLSVQKAQAVIRERAEIAVRRLKEGAFKPYVVHYPVNFEVDFKTTDAAHMACADPGCENDGRRPVVQCPRSLLPITASCPQGSTPWGQFIRLRTGTEPWSTDTSALVIVPSMKLTLCLRGVLLPGDSPQGPPGLALL
jgi:hypothetical protein